ncbi:SPOSA6832_00026, partial [Sporobolomyces salmonicolor]
MPRIPYQNPAQGTSAIGDAIRQRRGARGLTPLDQSLLNAPEIAASLLMDGTRSSGRFAPRTACPTTSGSSWCVASLPSRRCTIANPRFSSRSFASLLATPLRLSGSVNHAHVGTDAGLTPQQLTVIRDLYTPMPTPASPAPLSAYQAAALRFADASTYNVTVPQSRIDDLKQHLKDDQQLLEATAVVATYNMVSRLLVTLDVGDMGTVSVPLPETEQAEHEVEVEEGVRLFVKVAKRDGSSPWLVFVNSLMTNQTMWDGVLPRLSKKYNLLTFDQRGHGKASSSSVPPQPCTLEILANDVATILSKLSIPTPIHAIIGVSQGGATALAFAQHHSPLFARLIACDTQATSPAANSKAWDERIALARSRSSMVPLADVTVPRWFPSGAASELNKGGRREFFIHDMVASTPIEGFAAGAAALQGYDVAPGLADKLKGKEVLLVAGERDGALPGVLRGLKENLEQDGVDCRFEVVPGCGHLPMVDGAEAWLDIVEEFLA